MKIYKISERSVGELDFIVERDQANCRQERSHLHDGIEIMFTRRGAGFCSVNTHTFPLVPGDFYLMGEKDVHAFLFRHDGDYNTIAFHRSCFTPEELETLSRFKCFEGVTNPDFSFRTKYTFPPAVCSQLYQILDAAHSELLARQPMFRQMAKSLLWQFLILAGRKSSEASGMVFSGELTGEILDFIAANYTGNITLEQLGAKFGYSAEYIGRAFKRKTGMNITEYLTFFRVEKACSLLTGSSLNIAEIAAACGFFDNSHFCRNFRKIIGVPPSEYRNSKKITSP